MAGIHRTRPGADAMAGATGEAIDLGDRILQSSGWSNSYCIRTDDGRVVLNTGMGFEGPLHRRAYEAVDASPVRAVILTQGHYDHVGGIDVVRDPDSEVIAQANFTMWRDDNERLEAFRSRNSAFAFINAILAAMDHARELGASSTDSNIPISLGIPAVTIGSGGTGGRAHSLDEWIDVAKPESLRGMTVGLAAVLAMAGV